MPLDWRTMHVPFAAGVNTGSDPRSLQPPDLAVARDVEFEEYGGLQTRKPFAALADEFTDGRKIVAYGDELLLFTKTKLCSWSAVNEEWIEKASYLAPKISEQPVLVRTGEQTQADRIEVGGRALYAWIEDDSTTRLMVAAVDAETGAVVQPPTSMQFISALPSRPRFAIAGTKVLLFWTNGGDADLVAVAIDPDDIATSIDDGNVLPTSVVVADHNIYYDVVSNGTIAYVAYRRQVTTSYGVLRVTSALAVTSSVKARACDGPIAIALSPTGTVLQIARGNGTSVQGDELNSTTLADIFTAQAIGSVGATPINQIACAYRDVTDGGAYRCYAFWSSGELASSGITGGVSTNYVDTSGAIGTESTMVRNCGVASRAFCRGGTVFVWTTFAGKSSTGGTAGFHAQLQNSYFLYGDDGALIAKAAMLRAGGFASATGHLPAVQSLGDDVYAWVGTEQRMIDLGGNGTGYAARSPRDIVVTFDSDEARRCVRLGETLYITGGQILQYDGDGLAEVGFHVFPWVIDPFDDGTAGAIAAGTYTYKATYRWDNAKGELDRSTTASAESEDIAASHKCLVSLAALSVTLKQGTRSDPAAEVWRTLVDPTNESPFYLVTSKDPSDSSGDNQYLQNEQTALQVYDNLTDAQLGRKEPNPENGDVLPGLAPPPATVIAADQDRIFLAGVAGEPDRVWYSKTRGTGEVAAFHGALAVDTPPLGGAVTALAFLDETLIAFKETAIYALPGVGFDNTRGGQNYGPARLLSSDCGAVSAEGVAQTPAGLIFKSRKGWYLLGRGGGVEYIGGQVSAFDDDEVVAVHVMEAQHQIRCVTDARVLMFDYVVRQWSEWTEVDCIGAAIWGGTYHLATATEVKAEQTTHTALTYGLDVETAWLKVADIQGYGAVDEAMFLGEHRSACRVRLRVAYDFNESDASGPTWVDDKYFTSTPATVGGRLQFRHGPKYRKCEAIKFRLTAYAAEGEAPPTGEALKLTGMSLKLGFQRGLHRGLPAAQKQ